MFAKIWASHCPTSAQLSGAKEWVQPPPAGLWEGTLGPRWCSQPAADVSAHYQGTIPRKYVSEAQAWPNSEAKTLTRTNFTGSFHSPPWSSNIWLKDDGGDPITLTTVLHGTLDVCICTLVWPRDHARTYISSQGPVWQTHSDFCNYTQNVFPKHTKNIFTLPLRV